MIELRGVLRVITALLLTAELLEAAGATWAELTVFNRDPNIEFTIVNGGPGCVLESAAVLAVGAPWTLASQDLPQRVSLPMDKTNEFFRVRCGQLYSVIVGYNKLSIPPGHSLIANQLQGASTEVSAIFRTPPENTTVYKYSARGYDVASSTQPGPPFTIVNSTLGSRTTTLVNRI